MVVFPSPLGLTTFQSTPLRERRQNAKGKRLYLPEFQSTPLREGRHDLISLVAANLAFQSTPLREGRHYTIDEYLKHCYVSIHAPP